MPEKINWSVSVQVLRGPKIAESRSLEVEAYDKIQVMVPNKANNMKVDIQPGVADEVCFLLIGSDRYNNVSDLTLNLDFRVNLDTNPAINLDAPLLLIGSGAVGILDPGNGPTSLFFTNSLGDGEDATIQILVGRDATP